MGPQPKKKIDKFEQKEKKKQYDKLRREIMKRDPHKALEMQSKEQEKYKRKKEVGQVKLVEDMTEREKRAERKKWRERSLAYLKRKREKQQQGIPSTIQHTSPSSSASTSTRLRHKKTGKKRVKRPQTQIARENQRLRDENLRLRRKNRAIMKRLKKLQTVTENSTDPISVRKVVENLMENTDEIVIQKQFIEGGIGLSVE